MLNSHYKAYFNGKGVEIHGGYQHPETGCHAEFSGDKVPRQSISIWELCFHDTAAMEKIFKDLFNLTPEQAKQRDIEKRRVDDIYLKIKNVSIERVVQRALNKIPITIAEETDEEVNCVVLERVGLE